MYFIFFAGYAMIKNMPPLQWRNRAGRNADGVPRKAMKGGTEEMHEDHL
jgi:hypothetical protein